MCRLRFFENKSTTNKNESIAFITTNIKKYTMRNDAVRNACMKDDRLLMSILKLKPKMLHNIYELLFHSLHKLNIFEVENRLVAESLHNIGPPGVKNGDNHCPLAALNPKKLDPHFYYVMVSSEVGPCSFIAESMERQRLS